MNYSSIYTRVKGDATTALPKFYHLQARTITKSYNHTNSA